MQRSVTKLRMVVALALLIAITGDFSAWASEEAGQMKRIEIANRMRHYAFCIGFLEISSSEQKPQFVASGIVVSTNGHVLTCQHVLKNLREKSERENIPDLLDKLLVGWQINPKRFNYRQASIAYENPELDIAILKGAFTTDRLKFKEAVRFGDSSKILIATEVSICGFAYPRDAFSAPYVFRGIVSNVWETDEGSIFQTDIESYPGLSGAPLFVTDTGEIIGIIKGHYSPQDIPTKLTNFIPINSIKPIIETVVSSQDETNGEGN